ncbi:MAG: hypothetical protein HC863_02745, partial [Myxococcales bacterium]|nr:hypothetical protein [Myxococcales bacterium]
MTEWIDGLFDPRPIWFAKRLSADDTWANGAGRDAMDVPAKAFFKLFPELTDSFSTARSVPLGLEYASDGVRNAVPVSAYCRLVRSTGHTDYVVRVSGLGGATTPMLDPESTGALIVMAPRCAQGTFPAICSIWVSRSAAE